jgi:hypothetical protein
MHIEFILLLALFALVLINEWDKWKRKRVRGGS